jgi:predicted nucleotidyltransferase/predicted transcriptional regulator with HTH domain
MINFRSELRRKLLGYYFTNSAASHYVRELANILEVDPTNLSRELARLADKGIFSFQLRGGQKHFRLNKQYPLYHEVRNIVLKTVGVVPQLRATLATIAGIEEAYVYGSFAKGSADQASDIDVLIVGDSAAEVLASKIRGLERRLGREINYTVLKSNELKEKLHHHDPFIEDVWRGNKIKLHGS